MEKPKRKRSRKRNYMQELIEHVEANPTPKFATVKPVHANSEECQPSTSKTQASDTKDEVLVFAEAKHREATKQFFRVTGRFKWGAYKNTKHNIRRRAELRLVERNCGLDVDSDVEGTTNSECLQTGVQSSGNSNEGDADSEESSEEEFEEPTISVEWPKTPDPSTSGQINKQEVKPCIAPEPTDSDCSFIFHTKAPPNKSNANTTYNLQDSRQECSSQVVFEGDQELDSMIESPVRNFDCSSPKGNNDFVQTVYASDSSSGTAEGRGRRKMMRFAEEDCSPTRNIPETMLFAGEEFKDSVSEKAKQDCIKTPGENAALEEDSSQPLVPPLPTVYASDSSCGELPRRRKKMKFDEEASSPTKNISETMDFSDDEFNNPVNKKAKEDSINNNRGDGSLDEATSQPLVATLPSQDAQRYESSSESSEYVFEGFSDSDSKDGRRTPQSPSLTQSQRDEVATYEALFDSPNNNNNHKDDSNARSSEDGEEETEQNKDEEQLQRSDEVTAESEDERGRSLNVISTDSSNSDDDFVDDFEQYMDNLPEGHPDYPVRKLAKEFHSIIAKHDLSDRAATNLWDFVKTLFDDNIAKKMKSFITVRNQHYQMLPRILLDIEYEEVNQKTKHSMTKLTKFPKKLFKRHPEWRLISVVTYVHVEGILKLYQHLHPGKEASDCKVILSDDGVPESKVRSIDILTIKFEDCSIVFPMKIVRAERHEYVGPSITWPPVIKEINALGIQVTDFVADAKKRAEVMCQKQFNGYSSCHYCYAKGIVIPGKGNTVVYPASTWDEPLRTDDDVRRIMENLDKLPPAERHGIWGKSPLYDLSPFDFTRQIPAEYLHLVCLGVIRSLLTWSLQTPVKGGTKKDTEARVKKLERKLQRIKTPSEFSRRVRNTLDIPHMKGTELRNMGAFYFLLVPQVFPDNSNIRRIWTLLGFMLRLFLLPEEDYLRNSQKLPFPPRLLMRRWYFYMDSEFGTERMFYNNHVFGAHAYLLRKRGPFTATSAFPQEHAYGQLLKKFASGTMSAGKQILQRSLLHNILRTHADKRRPTFSGKDKTKSDDTILCLQNGDWYMFEVGLEIISEERDEMLIKAKKINTSPFRSEDMLDLDFSLVQLYKLGSVEEEAVVIDTRTPGHKIASKGIIVGDYIMTVPQGVFNEEL